MEENLFNESFDNTFLQLNDLGNSNEFYLSSHKFNLFQQFFIIGLEPKIIYNINKIELNSLPKKFLEPAIISKYPNIPLPYLCIPDKIIASHCFPKGLVDIVIKDENTEKLKDTNFIFSLDNQGYEEKENSLRTKRVYYNCYSFYESVEDLNIFINLRENKKNENNSLNKNYYIKKVICISSFQPLYKAGNIILRNLKKYIEHFSLKIQNDKIEIVENNYIPIEKIIEGLIFNIPSLPRTKYTIQMNEKTFNLDNNNKEKSKKEIIFKESPINRLPKPTVDISNLIRFFNIDEIFEIIKWIILEAPILFFCENINDLTYTVEGFRSLIFPFEYPYPITSILPEENYSMISIMKHFIFGINCKYSKEILLKKGINIQYLNMIIIVKIENRFNDIPSIKEKDKAINSPIIIFHSDKSKPILKLNQIFSYYNDNKKEKIDESKKQQINLPINHKEKLKKKFFENVETRFLNIKKKSNKNQYNKIICEELYGTIFNFFLHILLHYQEFCYKIKEIDKADKNVLDNTNLKQKYEKDDIIEQKYIENKLEINDIYKINDFLNIIPQNEKLFYSFFLNTKIFYDFIKKKTFPISLQDKFEILFFDEKINEKQAELINKQFSSPFLKYEFEDMKGNIFLSDFRKKITQNYKDFLRSTPNQRRAYNYFQYITEKEIIQEKNEDYKSEINLNQISFNYLVFPKLLNDDIFYKEEITIDKFWDPERSMFTSSNSNCIYNQFEKQGKLLLKKVDILKKYEEYNYSFDLFSNFTYKIKDCIHLLWLQYFSKTFHYTKLSERKDEFEKMMIILNNVKIVDQNTLDILFWTIYKYGDNNMIQNLFVYLKNKSYITYITLREKCKQQNNFIRYSGKNETNEEEKNDSTINKNKISFCDISYCENKLCNHQYNPQNKFLINESINSKINLIKFKCDKCQKEQNIIIKAIYNNEQGKFINIDFKLISPLALLKRKWFQDKLDLDLYSIIKEHIEPYMSAIFYFNLQDIYHEFMIPPKKNNESLSIINNITYNIEKEKKEKEKYKPINIIFSNKRESKKFKIEKKKSHKFTDLTDEEKKTLNKSVSQNYLKTLSKKRLMHNNSKLTEKKKQKKINDYSLELITEDFDISDNNKMIFEFKNNSNKNILKTENVRIKNKILNKRFITNSNIKGFPQKNQNSYEFFKMMKKKK